MFTRHLLATLLVTPLVGCATEPDNDTEIDDVVAPPDVVELPHDVMARTLDALATPRDAARVLAADTDELGMTHVRVRQLVDNVQVWEGESIVHLAADGSSEVTDARKPVDGAATRPALSADRAAELAARSCSDCTLLDAPDLWIVRDGERPRLAWRVQLGDAKTEHMPVVFVDAHDGDAFRSYDNVQTATGYTQYNGLRTIPAYLASNGYYYLEDPTYNLGIYDLALGDDPDNDPYSRIRDSDGTFVRNDAAQAMFSLRNAAEYYWGVHRRLNPDGVGGPGKVPSVDGSGTKRLSAFVDWNAANAKWTGVLRLGYGNASGTWTDLTSLDIVAHELTHGVVQYTAGLVYMNESGALNESFADVFGAMAERYRLGESAATWTMGEDITTDSSVLRYMNEPTLDGSSVDHYSQLLTGTLDNGYVHYNSGIGNKAFYLAAKGGTHRLGGAMQGIGADAAAKIWYRALSYMTSGSTYLEARGAVQNAARDLYGYHSPEWNAVTNAWAMCGVGIVANDAFTDGGFENASAEWTLSSDAKTTTAYPRSGSRALSLGGTTGTSGFATQDFSVDPLATSATLSFYLNIATDEWVSNQNDILYVDVIDALTGDFLTRIGTWSNVDRTSTGSYAFHGNYNLTAYRGHTLHLKLHSVNDASFPTTFRVDDMRVTITR